MVATATAAAGSQSQAVGAPSGGGATVPFFFGSNKYVEKITIDNYTITAGGSQEFVHNITPGGFLEGVRVEVRSSGGVAGTAAADNPGIAIQSASIENIDGGPIVYNMDGFAHLVANGLFRPWLGWYANRFDYVSGSNPSFSLYLQPEIRHTAGVLANTDARAQYRVRTTFNTGAKMFSAAPTTYPTLAVQYYLESWAQPDAADLHGNPIQPTPDGLNLATQRRHQILAMNSGSALNQFQLSNTGNELRGVLLIVRDNAGVRQDYLTDPIRWRLDNRTMGTFSPTEVFNRMADFYDFIGFGTVTRPTGVYMWPRFFQPGELFGEAWLPTTNATYTIFETASNASLTAPGTVEAITDEVIPVGNVPAELESI